MKRSRSNWIFATALIASLCTMSFAHAEALHAPAHRARNASMDEHLPARGMSMNQVRQRFGAPIEVLSKAGGDTRRHPTINRWRYADYTVYFERNRVIHSVHDGDAAPPRA